MLSGIAFGTLGIASIIEDAELISIEVSTQLCYKKLVFCRFLFDTYEVVAANIHVLLLRSKHKGICRMVIQLKNGEFFILRHSLDDNKRGIDMIDRQDVAIEESIFEEGANVLVFVVLVDRATPPRQHFLPKERCTFKSCCYLMRLGSSYNDRLSAIFDQFSIWIIWSYSLIQFTMFVIITRILTPRVAPRVRQTMAHFKQNGNRIKVFDRKEAVPQTSIKKIKSMQEYEDRSELQLAESIKALNLKDFSIKVHHLLVGKQKSAIFWSTVQSQFMNRLLPTTDPVQIRSYSKVLYSLSKSKKATGNYETKLSLVLPFATAQSFTTIITAMSRIAPYSQQFGYIVEMLYYKRKTELNPRQIIAVNYSLANNGRLCDRSIIDCLDSLNAVETITMLRCYDKSEQMTAQIMGKALVKLKSIQRQLNALDISDIIYLYLKHEYVPSELQQMLVQSYGILKRHINDICIQKIWTHLPKSLNKGRLKVKFVEEIITTIQILRKGRNMSEVIWKKMQPTFQEIENIELRVRLEKIY